MRALIVGALGKLKDQESASLLVKLLQQESQDRPILLSAIDAAGELAAPELAQPLAGHLLDPDAPTAIAVLDALAKIPGKAATAAMIRSLEDTRLEVRRQAVRVLADRRAPAAVPDLLKLIDDPQLGPAVLTALAKTPDGRALNAYLKALAGKDAALREQSRTAIAKIADEFLPVLELRANQLPPQVVAELQKALAKNERARKGPIFAIVVKVLEPTEFEAFARANPGDATRGQKLFEDAEGLGCIRCHSAAGKGGQIGPDLTKIGQIRTEIDVSA